MKIDITTTAWGDEYIEMWRRACLKTFLWPANRNVLNSKEVTWNFFTDEKYFDHVATHIESGFPNMCLKLRSRADLRNYIEAPQSAAILLIEECMRKESKLLMAPPDTLWSNGSVNGVLKVGREKNTCVVVPHARVHKSILTESFSNPLSGADLVRIAWQKDEFGNYEHLHRAWTDAEVGHQFQNLYYGGVNWQRIDEKIIEVIHRLPTVYLADFTKEDLEYFKAMVSFGGWDHTWPGDILMKRGRQRFVGSSDLAFMLEITDPHERVPPPPYGSQHDFWRHHHHNEYNKQFSAIFREE